VRKVGSWELEVGSYKKYTILKTSITISNISKSYEDTKALDSINLNISEGEIFGFIGPDGAGKTTLIRILTTLLLADEGSASVGGYDVVKDYKQIRNNVGYMPGQFSLYQDLTVEENLKFFAGVFKTTIKENYHLIKDIYQQIEPYKNRRAGKLSGGMKQKLALSCALIHKPKVLFLDEPTTGVDAVSRKEFWEMLNKLKQDGLTIVVSTPYMDEAALCDRVALIQKGKILDINSPKNIVKSFPFKLYSVHSKNIYHLNNHLNSLKETHSAYLFGESIHWTLNDKYSANDIINRIKENNFDDVSINTIEANIEDCFMELMTK
jgi:ABC-type multidrug transport system ATPase subunit